MGKKNIPSLMDFGMKFTKLFEEYQTTVHERRHGTYHYLPFAVSIRELIEQVKRRKPDIAVPSEEWVRLQFTPTNPFGHIRLKHLNILDIFL